MQPWDMRRQSLTKSRLSIPDMEPRILLDQNIAVATADWRARCLCRLTGAARLDILTARFFRGFDDGA